MIEAPHEVLSEHLQAKMRGRRLVAAVFTAFQFEPGFFEKEILPVFFDLNLSQASAIRLVQLDDSLRASNARIAVYYDANGLVASEEGSAKLDIARIPVRQKGIFHCKNVFALVEDIELDEAGKRPRSLLVATLSANLTRAGWWKNVEACHVEELADGATTRLRDGLLAFIATIRAKAPSAVDHTALDRVHDFVKKTVQGPFRSKDGELLPHIYGGTQSFLDFLTDTGGDDLRGLNLEIISPFFDETDESGPLLELVRKFKPIETRVFLPRNDEGAALVPEALYDAVRKSDDIRWGTLPGALTRTSNKDAAPSRNVHAKVYRFFSKHPKREYLVVGSVNLTTPAHQQGGNTESAIIVENKPPRRPEFWLDVDDKKPLEFGWPDATDGDLAASTTGSRLALRFDWSNATAHAYWDDREESPPLAVLSGGVTLFELTALASRDWIQVPANAARALKDTLGSTSFVDVRGDRPHDAKVLVLEEGMWMKPSIISRLSIHDILKYWSMLSVEQRNEFLNTRASLLLGEQANGLVTPTVSKQTVDSIFERFAGVFHAFECMREGVLKALEQDNEKEALYRVFGTKHDSLGSLLQRVREESDRDLVDRYLITMCARQLCNELSRGFREFWRGHDAEAKRVETLLDELSSELQQSLRNTDPSMEQFLPWFEERFLARAKNEVTA